MSALNTINGNDIGHAKSSDETTKTRSKFVLSKGMRRFRTIDVTSLSKAKTHSSFLDFSIEKKCTIVDKESKIQEQDTDSTSSTGSSERQSKNKDRNKQNMTHKQENGSLNYVGLLRKKRNKNKNKHYTIYKNEKISALGKEITPDKNKTMKAAGSELCALMADLPSPDPLDTILHLVFRKPYSEELIVDYLLKSGNFAEVIFKRNSVQDLPLHVAMRNEEGFSNRVYDALVDMNSKGVEKVNIDGSLPIHLLCAAGVPSIYCLKKLIKYYPESLQIQNKVCYPLQISSDQYVKGNSDPSLEESIIYESKPRCWWDLVLMSPTLVHSSDDGSSPKESVEVEYESNFIPLHLAVLNHAPPEAVECLIQADIESLGIRTSKDRTALDCANSLVVDKKLYNDSSAEVKNAFAAIELIETSMGTLRQRRKINETVKMTTAALKSIEKNAENVSNADTIGKVRSSFDAKSKWRSVKHTVTFVNKLLKKSSMLGPKVEEDENPVKFPISFKSPPNFDRVTIDHFLPVGFRRLRWALLRSQSPFLVREYLTHKMKNSEVKMGKWDKYDSHIGSHIHPEGVDEQEYVGAIRNCQYVMPKSGFVAENVAYETTRIVEYNDYCFVLEQTTKNPEVPFGNTFEARKQCVVINSGECKCRMVSSVSAVFPGKKPMIAWKIKNAMYSGCTDADVAFGELICEHAGNA